MNLQLIAIQQGRQELAHNRYSGVDSIVRK
jgi:hypothetical protein